MNFEKLERLKPVLPKLAMTGLLALGGLGLTACGEDSSKAEENPSVAEIEAGSDVSHEYKQDGTRISQIRRGGDYSERFAYCDGPDLAEQSDRYWNSGNDISRSADHPACEDGRLDPEDFAIPR